MDRIHNIEMKNKLRYDEYLCERDKYMFHWFGQVGEMADGRLVKQVININVNKCRNQWKPRLKYHNSVVWLLSKASGR